MFSHQGTHQPIDDREHFVGGLMMRQKKLLDFTAGPHHVQQDGCIMSTVQSTLYHLTPLTAVFGYIDSNFTQNPPT